jgi:ACS family glucarate transporter-like MFS transporter
MILVGLMFAFSVMSYFDRTIMSIAGPQIMKEFGIAPTQMGSIYSAFILGYFLFMIPGGQLADRLGPRVTLGLMGFAAALFTGLTALGGKPGLGSYLGVIPAFLAIRICMGVGTAPLYPACGRMGMHWIPSIHQARAQALIIAGSSMGGAVSPLVFSWLMTRYQWRGSYWIAAAVTAAFALVWIWYARDFPPGYVAPVAATEKSTLSSWFQLISDRNLALTTVAYFTLGYFDFIFFYWIYYYFGEIRHMGYSQSARYTTGLFLTMMVMMPLGGWVSDRLTAAYGPGVGRRMVPMVALALAGILLFAGTKTSGDMSTVALLSLAIGFASCCEGPFWSLAIDVGGPRVGAACGILNFGANLGGFFAPILTPYIASRAGWSWGLYTGSLVVMIGVVACYLIDPSRISANDPARNYAGAGPGEDGDDETALHSDLAR